MKPLYLCLCAAAFIFVASCNPTRVYNVEEKKVRIQDTPVFITKTDGEKLVGRKISTPGNFAFSHDWIKLDGHKFALDAVQNYQDRDVFCIKYNGVWARQLKRGKISLYWYITSVPKTSMSSPSGGTVYTNDVHFLFQKGGGPPLELSMGKVSELLSDNREAQARFDATFKPGRRFLPRDMSAHPKRLFEIIDIYNNS